ncbi:MAG: DUF3575 domain-containing protein [Bacteroidales bacterium]|nr:DUF3575 domain-containing protein [Bacteroidales bacterium]
MMKNRKNTISLRLLAVAALILSACLNADKAMAQQLAVKTNALSLAALTPSIGLEGVTGERTSLEVSFFGHYNPYGFKSKFLACQPEFRYWFGGRPLVREFVGVTAAAAAYNSTIRGTVYDGYALIAGITGGYAFNLGKRWNLELTAGVGVAGFAHKRYGVNDNYNSYGDTEAGRINSWGYKIIPVKLGVTFSYIIM